MNFLLQLFSCQDEPKKSISILKHKTISETVSTDEISSEMWIRKTDNIHSKFNYKIMTLLGQGAGGKVYLAEAIDPESKNNIGKVALKILPKSKLEQKRNYKKYLILQKRVHTEVKNSFMIKFIESFQSKTNCFIVLEYASGGSVAQFINKKRKMVADQIQECVRFIIACVVLGLRSLHHNKFAYRDLKPQNLLISQNGYVKIADFGLAQELQQGQIIHGCKCGTLPYFAPEMSLKLGHNKLVDFWCLGILTFQLFTKRIPFKQSQINSKSFMQIVEVSEKSGRFARPQIPYQAEDFISKLLKAKMQNRLGAKGFQEIMNHKFFHKFNWESLQKQEMKSPLLNFIQQSPKIKNRSHCCSSTDDSQNRSSFRNVSQFTMEGSPAKKRSF